ncbi:MAG: IS21 family transposase [Dermatophilaceae bacterium]
MICTDAQVRQMMKEREQGKTQQQAALKANVRSARTVRKYERLGKLPSELKQPRSWRTRVDPFAQDWGQIEQMLEQLPGLEVKALFAWLQEQQPGRYAEGQLRTLQRRVERWRAMHQTQVASLAQRHRPGELMQTDGTWLTELGVTIGGQPFRHILIHCVLCYSNWEWGCIAQSESVLAIRQGVQAFLHKLGYAPRCHQTDNSTAATYVLRASDDGQERTFHPLYLEMLHYYGMQPRLTHVGSPNENGDVESSNGSLKRALRQQLLLRGSHDFASVADYEQFVAEVMQRRNQARQRRVAEETAVMQPVTQLPLAAYRERRIKVSAGSLIRIQTNLYSVPTTLIGQEVLVRQYEWHLEVYYQQQLVQQMPRLVGREQLAINYRHLIDTLLRKPGGFRNYRYRQVLFPLPVFQQTWEAIDGWYSTRKADLVYLRILHLAAKNLESEVAAVCAALLAAQKPFDETDVAQLLNTPQREAGAPLGPAPLTVNLRQYDALLQGGQPC